MSNHDNDEKTGFESSILMNLSPKAQAAIVGGFIGIPALAVADAAYGLAAWTILPECLGVAGIVAGGYYMLKKNNINLKDQFQDLNWGALLGLPEQEEETSPPAKTVPTAVEETTRSPQTDLEAARKAIVPPGRHSMPLSPAMLQSTPSAQPAPLPMQSVPQMPTNRTVDLGDTLQLDIDDLVGKSIFVCGVKRSGKTTLGCKLVEKMGEFQIPMLIVDLKRDYISIADILPRCMVLSKNNITLQNAKQISKAIFEENYQVILDLASFVPDMDKGCEIACALVEGLFEWAQMHPKDRRPCEIVLDECQAFFPQSGSSVINDNAIYQKMLRIYAASVAQGGSLGLNTIILTQRIAETDKKIIGQFELLFLLKQVADNDLARYKHYTDVDPATIRGFKKGQGIFVDYEGNSHIVQFHNRTSDGSMSASPRASAVLKPLTKPVTRENFPYASELAVQSEPSETRVLEESEYEFEDDEWDIYRKPFAVSRNTDEVPVIRPSKSAKSVPARYESEGERKVKKALQYWRAGHSSVRKLEEASGWSNGECRKIIKLMRERGLVK